MPVDIDLFGKDHWSTFAYIEAVCVDGRGVPDLRRMRCDPARHPGLAADFHTRNKDKKYPTRLKGGILQHDHDDWDCADDLETAGLVKILGTGVNPIFCMTEKGRKVAGQLREWLSQGNSYSTFSPEV